MNKLRVGLLAALLLSSAIACQAAESGSTSALPGDSLYRLTTPLTSQRGEPFSMASLTGRPALITMFYGSCQLACPITLHNMSSTVAALSSAERAGLNAVLVSLDPKGDTPATLKQMAQEHGMAGNNWVLAVSDSDPDTRGFAAALGIRYRRLANGDINHSTRILVTDRQGRVVATLDDVAPDPAPAILQALHRQLK